MNNRGTDKSLLVGNIKEVIENKEKRNKYLFTYERNGNNYYTVDGRKVSVEAFNRMFPIKFKRNLNKGKNCDGTKTWMNE